MPNDLQRAIELDKAGVDILFISQLMVIHQQY